MSCLLVISALLFLAADSAKLEPRIIGGNEARIEDYPYSVSLQYKGSHVCGGAILANTRIITVAHCTKGKQASTLTVRVGSSDREQGGKVFNVSGIYQHPKYDGFYDYDVSILVLESSIVFNRKAQSISILDTDRQLEIGSPCSLAGWGTLQVNHFYAETLHTGVLPKMPDASCAVYGPMYNSRMSCHGYNDGGIDHCNGDSGGPLVCEDQLYGLSSFGWTCDLAGWPGVYTKLVHPEILEYINKFI